MLSGKAVALGVTSAQRNSLLPNVPTIVELGYKVPPGMSNSVFAPKGTPEEIVKKISDLGSRISQEPAFRSKLMDMGILPAFEETKTFEESELSNYEYTLEIKKLTIPDFAQLFSQKGATTEEASESYEGNYFNDENQQGRNSSLEKVIFEELKKNIEKIIWQAKVTIMNKETKYTFTRSTFITNYNERVQLNVGF